GVATMISAVMRKVMLIKILILLESWSLAAARGRHRRPGTTILTLSVLGRSNPAIVTIRGLLHRSPPEDEANPGQGGQTGHSDGVADQERCSSALDGSAVPARWQRRRTELPPIRSGARQADLGISTAAWRE